MNRKLFNIAVLSLASLTSAFCLNAAAEENDKTAAVDPELQRQIVIATPVWEYDLNPQTASYATESQVLTGLYEGLFSYNPLTVEAVPAICESWKISRDKKRWTFTLRENAKFSNGEQITAQVMKDSWLKLLSNPDASFASMLDCITNAAEYRNGKCSAEEVKITAKDDRTLTVHLNTPTEQLPQILCHNAFCAVSSEEKVYSGAYILKEYSNSEMLLEKNPEYWDAEHVYTPSIKFLVTGDTTESTFLYNNGEIDWLSKDADLNHLISGDDIQLYAEFGTTFYFFKSQGKIWDKPGFKRALIEAIPYETLRKDYYLPAETLVYPLTNYPEVNGFTDHDEEDALDMMKDARKAAGIPEDEVLSLTIAISSDNEYEMKRAEILKEAWEPLGVEVTIQGTPEARYNASIAYWNADLFIYGWIGDYADPMAFLELFKGGSSLNASQWSNADYDLLLEKASAADNTRDHYDYLSQAEQMLLDEGEVIPVCYSVAFQVINTDCIGGWFQNALDIHPLKYLYIKPVKLNLENLI